MEHWFYHLKHAPLESVLPQLVEKSLERGWTVKLQFDDAARMAQMDSYLWTYKNDSFLPHGREDQPGAQDHPVRLGLTGDASGADIVFLIGASKPGDLSDVKRCITLVDDRDPAGRDVARARWTSITESGGAVAYWQQSDEGHWIKR